MSKEIDNPIIAHNGGYDAEPEIKLCDECGTDRYEGHIACIGCDSIICPRDKRVGVGSGEVICGPCFKQHVENALTAMPPLGPFDQYAYMFEAGIKHIAETVV